MPEVSPSHVVVSESDLFPRHLSSALPTGCDFRFLDYPAFPSSTAHAASTRNYYLLSIWSSHCRGESSPALVYSSPDRMHTNSDIVVCDATINKWRLLSSWRTSQKQERAQWQQRRNCKLKPHIKSEGRKACERNTGIRNLSGSFPHTASATVSALQWVTAQRLEMRRFCSE